MKKVEQIFKKSRIGKQIFCMIMTFVVLFTMLAAQLPEGLLTVKAAEGDMNITMHFDNSVYGWESPAIQFWGGTLTPSNYASGPDEITGWGGAQGYTLVDEENGWYSITLTGSCDGFQFLDMANPNGNTGGKGYSAYMKQYTDATPKDLYFKPYENNYAGVCYTDAACTTELVAPADESEADVKSGTYVTLHFNNNAWSWGAPAFQYWGGDATSVSGYQAGPTEIEGWGGAQGYTLKEDGDGWYSITLRGDFTGFQFLDMSNPACNTAGKGYNDNMAQYAGTTPTNLYFKESDTTWYMDADYTTPLKAPEGSYEGDCTLTLHYSNPNSWDAVALYMWDANDHKALGGWPGSVMKADKNNDGWYTTTVELEDVQSVNYIFNNNNNGSQTGDLSTKITAEAMELWYDNDTTPKTEAPEGWKTSYAVTLHCYNSKEWDTVYAYTWNSTANPTGAWPGSAMTENALNDGWYDISVENLEESNLSFIFNNNSGSQTKDLSYTLKLNTTDIWAIPGAGQECSVSSTAPEGWLASEKDIIKSNYYVDDVMEVRIGETVYPMSVFADGVFETTAELEAGTYTATLITNGKETRSAMTAEFALDEAGKVAIRLNNDGLTAVEVPSAAIVGNLNTAFGAYKDWDPADEDADLTYLGNGLYMGTITFDELKADADLEYKVAFNDGWNYSIGADGGSGNVKVTVPAGRTSFTVFVDEINKTIHDDVTTPAIKINGADFNPYTTTVSIIGTVRGLGGDDWNTGLKGYEFTRISDTLYRYETTLGKGTHTYKAVFNYGTWYDIEGSGNRTVTLTSDDVKVIFLYDTTTGYLYDTVNNEEKVASLLSMKVRPAEMEIIENASGTITFVATAKDGQKVTLYYGEKAEVEANGTSALTKVEMSTASNGKSSSGELWLGDAALDLVYYYDIDGTRTLDESKATVKVGDADYSNYEKPEYTGRVMNVPGTFPGPSWDAASNVMTYNGNRIYSYTFKDVPAAKYEFKIAAAGSWAENYGADGKFDGSNMKVAVPSTQDVTIYYSDVTHLAVNSIDYKFADITLKGTGIPEGTKLTDEGLTGIYSVKVELQAGTYSDVVIICDGKEYKVAEFTLEKAKTVTFCMDPVTTLYYHDASDVMIETADIYFDSKDEAYKSIFGAVATGEEVTFTLATGTDIMSASLIVKGNENKSVPMEKAGEAENGVQKWSVSVSFATIGEYSYYFAVSNGSSVKVYGDDDGYYGTGIVTDLTEVKPYDLVVYKSGFETPDWMKNAVIYQIFPDRFFDGDESNNDNQTTARGAVDYEYITDWYTLPENPEQEGLLDEETYKATGAYYGDGQWSNEIYGGDLEGITERIDYLEALGVTVIYLNPVFSSISSHRYDACDYTEIDPILGTLGDFEELVSVAEQHGMKVVLDGVFNHVSDDSVYFDRYYKFLDDGLDTIGAYPYWAYVYDYMADNDVDQETAEAAAKEYFTAEYGITDYSYVEWFDVFTTTLKDDNGADVYDTIGLRTDKPVYGYDGWWGYDSMPIIKSTNGSEYQTGNWAEKIIYNENNTSVTQYWISKGMDGWRLDVANEVSDETWQHFRNSVKSLDSEAVIIGEIWDDATKYILGDMYDSVMNYMFRNAVTSFAMGTDAESITKDMERLRERYPQEAFYAMMNLVGSHDTTRILSYLDGIGDDRNQKDIDSAFPTYEKTSDLAKQRQYLVAFLQFTYAGAPTIYYGDEIGMVGSDDPDDRRAFEWGKGNEALVTYYATLAEIRSQYSALRTGTVEAFDTENANVLAYVRRDSADCMIVLANNSESAQQVSFKLSDLNVTAAALTDILNGAECTIKEGVATVSVPALSGVILTEDAKEIVVDKAALAPAYDSAYIVAERSEVPPADEKEDDSEGDKKPGTGNKPGNGNKPGHGNGNGNNHGNGNNQGNDNKPGNGNGHGNGNSQGNGNQHGNNGRPGNGRRPVGHAGNAGAQAGRDVAEQVNGTTAEEVIEEQTEVAADSLQEDTTIVEEDVPLTDAAADTAVEKTSGVNAGLIAALVATVVLCGGVLVIYQVGRKKKSK